MPGNKLPTIKCGEEKSMLGSTMFTQGKHVIFRKKYICLLQFLNVIIIFYVCRHPFQGQLGLSDLKIRLAR